VTKTISSLNTTISVKEQELNNLKSQLKKDILNQQEKKEKYESSNTKYLEECKKKEDKIKQEFDSNNVSRIKLYFLKEIYDINNSDTHSSLHVKCDWDIGEIKYDGGASNKRLNEFLSEQLKKWQDQGESIKIEPSEIKETCDRLNNLLKEELSDEEYHEMMDNLNNENLNIVENTVGKKFAEYLKNNYTSVGNKEIKKLEQIDKNKKDYMEKIKIRINEDYMKKAKENAVAMLSPRSQYVPLRIRNKKR
uniref:hypothetical protein n=1 Tax=Candidatus Phytoplasma sp. AldY-WA1 TaxID=2852100 RepID=UPI002549F9FA